MDGGSNRESNRTRSSLGGIAVTSVGGETRGVPATRFQALIQTHVEPVLVQAGFARGQWAKERGATDDPFYSVIFCASTSGYVGRYPSLTDNGPHWADAYCIDITIEGSIGDGVTRLDVEYEPLEQLLDRTGRRSDAERLPRLLRLRDPEHDIGELAELLSDVYLVPS
jgi:hypothetical protein